MVASGKLRQHPWLCKLFLKKVLEEKGWGGLAAVNFQVEAAEVEVVGGDGWWVVMGGTGWWDRRLLLQCPPPQKNPTTIWSNWHCRLYDLSLLKHDLCLLLWFWIWTESLGTILLLFLSNLFHPIILLQYPAEWTMMLCSADCHMVACWQHLQVINLTLWECSHWRY